MPVVTQFASGAERRFPAPVGLGVTQVRVGGAPAAHIVLPGFGIELLHNPAAGTAVTIDYGGSDSSPSNTFVLMGDSIAANWYVTSTNATAYSDFGFMSWAQALSGQRLVDLNPPAALGGTTSRTWLTRVETEVLPYSPGWVVCYLGTNDISGDIPVEETIANLGNIWGRILAAGSRLIVCTVLPYGAGNALNILSRNVARSRLNRWIMSFASTTPGVRCADTYTAAVDHASTVGACKANVLWDDLHPSGLGARLLGRVVADVIEREVVDAGLHVASFTDSWTYSPLATNKLTNPLFNSATGTAGATSAGAGTTITATSIARDWTVATVAGGTSTTVCTTPAAPDGVGLAQRLVITGTNATDAVTLRSGSLASARLVAGERMFGEVFIRLTNCVNVRSIRLLWSYGVDGVTTNHTGFSPQNTAFDQTDTGTLVLRTPEFTVPAAALTSGQLQITVAFTGAGSCNVDVWRPSLRVVN